MRNIIVFIILLLSILVINSYADDCDIDQQSIENTMKYEISKYDLNDNETIVEYTKNNNKEQTLAQDMDNIVDGYDIAIYSYDRNKLTDVIRLNSNDSHVKIVIPYAGIFVIGIRGQNSFGCGVLTISLNPKTSIVIKNDVVYHQGQYVKSILSEPIVLNIILNRL